MTFELRDKQVPGYLNLVMRKRHLLRAYMGTGKTVMATKAMYDTGVKRVLIICPKNAIRVWEDHIKAWIQGLDEVCGKDTSFNIHRSRKKHASTQYRKSIMSEFDATADINIWISTGSSFLQDVQIFDRHNVNCIIIDEARKLGLASRKSKLFEALKPFCRKIEDFGGYFWPLTGTPGRIPQHFWPILHLCDRKYFSSYHRFEDTFYYTQPSPFGGKELLGLRNQEEWYRILDRFSTELTKESMGHNPTQRQQLWVDMDEEQERIYNELDRDSIADLGSDILVSSTSLTTRLRQRQLLCCPRIIDGSLGLGAAFGDFLEQREDLEHPTVIFVPFKEAIQHFINHLAQSHVAAFALHGGLSPDEVSETIKQWQTSHKGVIICTIQYAQAFSLEPARECFFIGREYTPEDNAQAEERLNRLTTNYLINAYYYCYNNTYDADHNWILEAKTNQEQETLNRDSTKM